MQETERAPSVVAALLEEARTKIFDASIAYFTDAGTGRPAPPPDGPCVLAVHKGGQVRRVAKIVPTKSGALALGVVYGRHREAPLEVSLPVELFALALGRCRFLAVRLDKRVQTVFFNDLEHTLKRFGRLIFDQGYLEIAIPLVLGESFNGIAQWPYIQRPILILHPTRGGNRWTP